MPLYEYKCPKGGCNKEQERFFSMSDKPQEFEDKCEGCGEVVMLKSILSPSMITGFLVMQSGDRVK